MLDFWQQYCITLTHTLKVDTWSSGLVVCWIVVVIGWTYLFMYVLSWWTVSVSAYLFPRLSLSHGSLSLHSGCQLLCNAPVRMHEKETRLRLHVKNMSSDTWDCWRARSVSTHTVVCCCHRRWRAVLASLRFLCFAPRVCACLYWQPCQLSASGKSNYGPSI